MSIRRLLWSLPLLVLLLTAVAWFWLLHTQSGARWIWSQVESATDGSLTAGSISGSLASSLVGRDIIFDSDGVTVTVNLVSLSVDVKLLPISVTVLPASVSDLRIDLKTNEGADEGADIHDTLSKLRLPVGVDLEVVELDGGTISDSDGDLIFAINSATIAGHWKDAFDLHRLDIDAPLGGASGNGRVELHGKNEIRLDADLVARPALTGLDETIPIAVTVQGPLDALVLQVRTDEPRAHLRGQISNITNAVTWEAQLDLPALVFPKNAGVPEIPPLELSAEGRGDAQTFAAQAQVGLLGTDMQVLVAAEVDIGAATVTGDLDWRDAHWPIGEAEPQLSSRTGNVTLSGSLDNWTVAGTIELDVPELPPGTLTIEGGGDRDGASARILDGDVLGGSIAGRVEYSWRGTQPFAAKLELEKIRTATVLPDRPAVLSGKLDLSGQQQPFQLSARLSDVAGAYGDRTLRADGGVDIIEKRVSVNDLWVRHGETSVQFDGDLYAVEGLRYELYIDDLEYYLEDAFGSIAAAGSLSLDPNGQFLRIGASSAEFGWRDFRIVNLAITDRGEGILDVVATADSLQLGAVDAGQLQLQARLDWDSQSITVDTFSGGLRSTLSAKGAVDNWESPSSWYGELTKLEIEHDDFSAALDEPAAIVVSKQSASIERYCVVGHKGIKFCTSASWDSSSGLDLAATVASLPVDLVNVFVDTGANFDQVVSGEFSFRTQADGALIGRGDIAMTPGRLISAEDPNLYVDTGQARFGFDIHDDSLRGGVLNIPFPGLGRIAAEFEMLDVTNEGPAEIDGLVNVDLEDIGLLIALFPIVDSADGVLRADLDIGGTVDDPLISGALVLEDGALTYLPAGMKLDEIELRSELQEDGEVELTGSFRAGEGHAEIRTRADHARTAATGLELTLRGEDLTVIDLPDVRAVADTDLRLSFDGETLDLNGNITIPHARIRPENIGTTRVYESEDVIISAGELPNEPTEDGVDSDIAFSGSVEITLGNDVIVDLDVSQVQVIGNTLFTWTGDPIPNALGRYYVFGEILAFGQRLEITEGSVRFDDVPADDPYLRIRAEREIFGNTQVRRAGVLVAGTVSRPTTQAYTDPVTTEERALTLLVTGSDFDLEQGVGAVDFGTYIAPRIFVSYGIGLFDRENVIRVRYDLKRGLGVTATSGQKESGADLSYRFEN